MVVGAHLGPGSTPEPDFEPEFGRFFWVHELRLGHIVAARKARNRQE